MLPTLKYPAAAGGLYLKLFTITIGIIWVLCPDRPFTAANPELCSQRLAAFRV